MESFARTGGREAHETSSESRSEALSTCWTWPAGLTALALILRLYQLGAESLWIDEGYSLLAAGRFNLADGIKDGRPLYFAFLSLWMHLGNSEFILRLPSALFGGSAVLITYMLGKKLASERTGALASALMAISPLHVNHSQEVRMYSMASLLVLLAMYQFVLFLDAPKPRHMFGYLAFTVLSVATFPLTALLLVVQNLAAFTTIPCRKLRKWMVVQLLAILPCVPIFSCAVRACSNLSPEKSGGPSILDLVGIVGSFSLFTNSSARGVSWYMYTTYTLCTLGLILFGLMRGRRRWNTAAGTKLFLILWLLIPWTATAELVRVTGAQWLPRYLIHASPAYFLLLGLSVEALTNKRVRSITAAVILMLPAVKLARYYERPLHPQWREVTRFIESHEVPGDVIAIYRPGNGYVFGYYYRGKQPWEEIGGPKLQKKTPWTEKRVAQILGDPLSQHRRVWLLMSEHDPEGGKAICRYIWSRYAVLDQRSCTGIDLLLYKTRTVLPDETGSRLTRFRDLPDSKMRSIMDGGIGQK